MRPATPTKRERPPALFGYFGGQFEGLRPRYFELWLLLSLGRFKRFEGIGRLLGETRGAAEGTVGGFEGTLKSYPLLTRGYISPSGPLFGFLPLCCLPPAPLISPSGLPVLPDLAFI